MNTKYIRHLSRYYRNYILKIHTEHSLGEYLIWKYLRSEKLSKHPIENNVNSPLDIRHLRIHLIRIL